MEHKIILKCRVCLDEADETNMFDLFDGEVGDTGDEEQTHSMRKLYLKLEYCCGVKIRPSNEMPTKMCTRCFDLMRMWFNFRQMCVNAQVYLESLCTDRDKPTDLNDSDYLEYLYEDLQTSRRQNNDVGDHDGDYNDNDFDELLEKDSIDNKSNKSVDETQLYDADDEEVIKIELESAVTNHVKLNENEEDSQSENEMEQHTFKRTINRQHVKKPKTAKSGRVRRSSVSSYMCTVCGNVYNKKSAFTYHMTQHSNVKPHECEICGKSFRQVCELRNHMRRHTGEKPFKCSFCERCFIDRSEKHRHERVHTNTRPYVCSVCGKTFMYSAILKNHSKVHSGEKEYNCLVCEKEFTLQHQLKAHLQTLTHKQKEEQLRSAGYEVIYE